MTTGEWTLHTDGASQGNPGRAGIGVVLRAPNGSLVAEVSESVGRATCNMAEYLALITGLTLAQPHTSRLVVYADSKLVVEQMKGRWKVKNAGLQPLNDQAQALALRFARVRYVWIPRERNKRADALAGLGVMNQKGPQSR